MVNLEGQLNHLKEKVVSKWNEYLIADKKIKEQADSAWGDGEIYSEYYKKFKELQLAIENLNSFIEKVKSIHETS